MRPIGVARVNLFLAADPGQAFGADYLVLP